VRYRYGVLMWGVGGSLGDALECATGYIAHGDGLDGFMDKDTMLHLTGMELR
jgi:hypothetical protein